MACTPNCMYVWKLVFNYLVLTFLALNGLPCADGAVKNLLTHWCAANMFDAPSVTIAETLSAPSFWIVAMNMSAVNAAVVRFSPGLTVL